MSLDKGTQEKVLYGLFLLNTQERLYEALKKEVFLNVVAEAE